MQVRENVNATALVAGATAMFGAVGALSATGAIGRLERNEADALKVALILLLLGGVMFVAAGLPITSGASERVATVLGTGLTVVGLGIALITAVTTASQRELPAIDVKLSTDGRQLDGAITAGNLESQRKFSALVEGLKIKAGAGTQKWDVFTVAQYYVGPDGDGKIALPIHVLVPDKGYDAIGIKAWSDDEETCGKYPRRVPNEQFKRQVEQAGTGCVVVPLPTPAAQPPPKLPKVTLKWIGNPKTTRRVRLRAGTTATSGTVALVATQRVDGRSRELLHVTDRLAKPGGFLHTANLRASKDATRICAVAAFVTKEKPFRKRYRRCALAPGVKGAQLQRPKS
jgi:hypothetical protein